MPVGKLALRARALNLAAMGGALFALWLASCHPGQEPPPAAPSCGGLAGAQCPGAGKCVDDPSDRCDPNRGGGDCPGQCSCLETALCIQGDVFDSSPDVCACVPKEEQDPCASVRCQAGTHCVANETGAQCEADEEQAVFCGGIAAFPCPGAGRCVDDPSDNCDPKNGGADCGGICTCIEQVACIRDSVFDSSPSVCACVPMSH